jgi:hypothetical protein
MRRPRARKIPKGVHCFIPKGYKCPVLYCVSVVGHDDVVKVGQTTNWQIRRKAYANWNLSRGDGITRATVFEINEEYVELGGLEAMLLAQLRHERKSGFEWLIADYEEVEDAIRALLLQHEICFTEEAE